MSILTMVSGLFEPATKLVGKLSDNKVEQAKLQSSLNELKLNVSSQIIGLESKALDAQSKVIQTEANGSSWMQRNWRPITMLTFLALVVADSFGLLANPLNDGAWLLLQIGLGGYVVGRSAEKIIPTLKGGK